MAKNKSRRKKPAEQKKPENTEIIRQEADISADAAAPVSAEAAVSAPDTSAVSAAGTAGREAEAAKDAGEPAAGAEKTDKSRSKKKDILYQVVSKRDSGVIKAYITFTYRVFHPGVSARLCIYGLLLILPGLFFFKDIFWKVFFTGVGAVLILLAFFRQYISLWITMRNDPDCKAGTEFTYNFYDTGADFLRDDTSFMRLDRYKDISNFYYDDEYYYLTIQGRDFFVIPKASFTVGDPVEFEEFIYRKSKHTCRWIPNKLSDKLKKRRAERAVAAKKMMKR